MTILITGCCGFIGSWFTKILLFNSDYKIVGLDKLTYAGSLDNIKDLSPRFSFVKGDICNCDLVSYLFETHNITKVVNFAAETHVDNSIKNSNVFLQSNFIGVHNLLEVFKKYVRSNSKFIQISTDEVYGPAMYAFSENDKLTPGNPYAATKAAADHLVLSYHNTFNTPVCITRSANNYGSFQFPEKLIPLSIQRVMQNKNIPIYGDGQQVRDWLHVEDNCKAILNVLEYGNCGEIYNISANEREITNLEVATKILELIKMKDNTITSEIEFVIDRLGHDKRYAILNNKIKRLGPGWKPVIKFDDGLVRTVNWYFSKFKK